ncbi:MAG: TetR/AcrR family transcriptional regulator [Flavobacterium sp.]
MRNNDRKSDIIISAARLFKEKGYSAVTMRDLAKELNIKAASLYNHIASKQEILVLIVISLAEEFTEVMNEILESNVSNVDKIDRVIHLHVEISHRNPDALACLNNDWMHLTEDQLAYFLTMREDYEKNFIKIVEEGVAKGEFKALQPKVTAFTILSTLRTMYLWIERTKDISVNELTYNVKGLLLEGIRK